RTLISSGPTGVGKTEIARRMAKLVNAPFLKVEASKYTEVGYHGRDVESMVRDLLELGINMVRGEQAGVVRERAEAAVEQRLVSLLMGDSSESEEPHAPGFHSMGVDEPESSDPGGGAGTAVDTQQRTRLRLLEKLRDGVFEDREIEINITEKQSLTVMHI